MFILTSLLQPGHLGHLLRSPYLDNVIHLLHVLHGIHSSHLKGNLLRLTFSDLLSYRPFEEDTLFSDNGNEVIIPPPIKVFKPINFLEVQNV